MVALTFGLLESLLAGRHGIASTKRTQFQGRLRKLQRLGIPSGVGSGRGIAGRFSAGQVAETALALEFTELGILPERLQRIMRQNHYVIGLAMRMAATSLKSRPEIIPWEDKDEELLHMFLYFDPNALRTLTDQEEEDWDWASASLFRNGAADLRDKLVGLTLGTTRMAIINVTVMLGEVARAFDEKWRDQFLDEVYQWAEELEERIEDESDARLTPEERHNLALRNQVIRAWRASLRPDGAGVGRSRKVSELRKVLSLPEIAPRIEWSSEQRGDQPEAVLRLPGDHGIPISSFDPPDDDGQMARCIRAEVNHLRRDVDWKGLNKEANFALLFVPSEAILSTALEQDESLWEWALVRRVMLATVPNMKALTEAVAEAWRADIADEGESDGNGD